MIPNPLTRAQVARRARWSCAGLLWLIGAASAHAERPAPDLVAGREAYAQHCARCHGLTGHADGVDAKRFYPRPRDLTLGAYKFRSTASGAPPTDDDLFRAITQGLPGSNMPDWQHLDERIRWQLVDYLKSLAPIFQQTQPSPVNLAPDPGPAHADRAKGKALYEKLGCAACHGSAGRANGTSAAGLVDDWGMPIRPANLTQGWAYRGGSDPRSVTLRVLTGIDGAGMPSYADAVSPEEAWQLAYYVTSLQEPAHWNLIARALRVEGALPTSSDDPRWAAAERTDVELRNAVNPAGEWSEPPTVRAVSFAAVYHEDAIAFHMTWDDPTHLVVGQGPAGVRQPAAFGSATRWWDGPTQDAKTPADGLALLFKTAGHQGDVVTLQAWPAEGAPPLELCYWSAQSGEIQEAVAADFDSVIGRSNPRPVLLKGAAAYDNGRWRLALQRPLNPAGLAGAMTLRAGEMTSVAFAVWDGGNPNARAVSPWIDVMLTPHTNKRRER